MRFRLCSTLALLTLCALPLTAQRSIIVGSWRGTSTCVDKVHWPACHDEVVIYDVTPFGSTADSVKLRADKVVNGVRDFMGDSYFVFTADSSWVARLQMGRDPGRIVLRINGSHMAGTLTDVTSGRAIRALVLDRVRP